MPKLYWFLAVDRAKKTAMATDYTPLSPRAGNSNSYKTTTLIIISPWDSAGEGTGKGIHRDKKFVPIDGNATASGVL